MDIRQLTPRYSGTPQIRPEDLPAIKAAGFVRVICNRPDAENPPEWQAAAMSKAAHASGLEFVDIPLTHQTMNEQNIAAQNAAAEGADGPVLAYCASGTRCTVIWSLARAAEGMPVDEILQTAAKASYDLSGLRPRLEQG